MTIRTAATTAAKVVPEPTLPVEWREPIAPLRVLSACGWLSRGDTQNSHTCVESISSSHAVFKVTASDGRAAVVKQVPRSAALAGRSLRQELFVYRLARSVPELAETLPLPHHIDEGRQVLVLAAIDAEPWSVTAPAQRPVVERLATLMAGWHRATQETGLWPSPALGILELPDALEMASSDRAATTRRLMAEIAADGDLAAVLRETRAAWQDRCLVHGDVRRENVLTAHRSGDTTVKVVDWELSGAGDPAWDIAGVLAEVTLDSVRQNREQDRSWSRAQRDVVKTFVRTYRTSGGLVGADAPAFWHHVASCSIARLLHVACEWAEVQVSGESGPQLSLLAAARGLLQRRSRLTATLIRWGEA